MRPSGGVGTLDTVPLAATIADAAMLHGLHCRECSNPTRSATFEGRSLRLSYIFTPENSVVFEVRTFESTKLWPAGFEFVRDLFIGGVSEREDQLRLTLRRLLRVRFEGLEYVERLEPPELERAGRDPTP